MNDMDQEVLLLTTSINPPSATTCGEVLVGERALHPHEVILKALQSTLVIRSQYSKTNDYV